MATYNPYYDEQSQGNSPDASALVAPQPTSPAAPSASPYHIAMPDIARQFSDIMAPYQSMAKQFSSPYALFRPDSWIAQNHPGAARMLDAIGLSAAMTPGPQGPEGAGQGISRAFQGLVGAQQFRREQMLKSAMLPYQMAMPMIQARDVLAQTAERQAMTPYYLQRGEYYTKRMEEADRSKFVPGSFRTDDEGNKWQEIFNPVEGRTRLFNPATQKFADQMDKPPSFTKDERQQRMSTPGGLAGEIISMQTSPDPAVREQGRVWGEKYKDLTGQLAGGRKGGEEPYTEDRDFMNKEYADAKMQIEKPVEMFKFFEQYAKDPKWSVKIKGDSLGAYNEYLKQKEVEKQQFQSNWSTYYNSGAWRGKNKVGFDTYVKNPGKYDSTAPEYAPNPATASSGSSWQPAPSR